MSTEPQSLFSLARNKLQSVVGGGVKDSSSLHRWVLLKNSIIRSHVQTPATSQALDEAEADSVYRQDEEIYEVEHDAFMFPDPHSTCDDSSAAGNDENQWLDSVLEGLGDDEDDYLQADALPFADEEIEPLSPMYSPMSSSDDLVEQPSYYDYPLIYPPFRPPVSPTWSSLAHSSDSILPPTPALYDNPLPYLDVDELDDSPVPDAIEDTSDDESDAPSTPSAVSTPSLSPPGPTIPMPRERTRLLTHPHVYVERDDSYFYPFELDLDPLPLPDDTLAPSLRAYRDAYSSEC